MSIATDTHQLNAALEEHFSRFDVKEAMIAMDEGSVPELTRPDTAFDQFFVSATKDKITLHCGASTYLKGLGYIPNLFYTMMEHLESLGIEVTDKGVNSMLYGHHEWSITIEGQQKNHAAILKNIQQSTETMAQRFPLPAKQEEQITPPTRNFTSRHTKRDPHKPDGTAPGTGK